MANTNSIYRELRAAGILKKPSLYVMTGIPGSGKTTAAKDYGRVISSDDIRDELDIHSYDRDSDRKVFTTLENRVMESLLDGFDTVYDSTNISSEKRNRIIRDFKDVTSGIISVFVDTPLEESLERNSHRSRNVLEEVIKKNGG